MAALAGLRQVAAGPARSRPKVPSRLADTATPAPRNRLRFAILTIALLETAVALSNLPGALQVYDHDTALLIVAQWVARAYLAAAPVVAAVALWFAVKNEPRRAILALAVLMLAAWLAELPALPIHGFRVPANWIGLIAVLKLVLFPVLAIIAIVLAVKGERLPLAAMLVAAPLAAGVLTVLGFAAGVGIHGF